ncbi:RidA family protein [Pelagicoccus sp. NFK12]|uniref:RidA family protein n=1 Tax=Pelagicoccus enzymogenes TaxID=2773457 RepID=A0A927FB82_9BACT|nr:RidA family protein [Pelagicoccus enzymogenes]MBD5780530.1 RidA family protein [Pelagicoccus enzymogenes]MDQ8197570.1 RidA family protein [Pelagicoccus enzymogenes]
MRFPSYSKTFTQALYVSIFSILTATLLHSQSSPGERLKALGIELPPASKSVANYQPAVRSGNLVFLAGAIAKGPDNQFIKGKLGYDFSVEDGYQTSRLVSIALLAALKAEIGDLDKVERIVRVEGFVNSTPDFEQQSLVINGCSDLLVEVFGEKGRHSRIAIGAQSLPFGAPVEISAIIQVRD